MMAGSPTMQRDLITRREILPGFGLQCHIDQYPLAIYSVLSITISGKTGDPIDCAAYQGIGPVSGGDALIESVRAVGLKMSERAARGMFPEIGERGLRWRQ